NRVSRIFARGYCLLKGESDESLAAQIGTCRVQHRRSRVGAETHRRVRSSMLNAAGDRKSTRLNSSHLVISYAVFCLKKKINNNEVTQSPAKKIYRTGSLIRKNANINFTDCIYSY